MRLIIDINVLISGLLTNGPPRRVLSLILDGGHSLLIDHSWLAEANEVVSRPKFTRKDLDGERRAILKLLIEGALLVRTTSVVTECDDVKDRYLLALALDGAADTIVSGDKHLLVLHPWRGIDILRPAEFIETERRRMDS